MSIEEKQVPPNFALNDSSGKPVSLSDYRGKRVIIYFYPKNDTPGCTKEAVGFKERFKEFRKAQYYNYRNLTRWRYLSQAFY